MHFPRKDRNGVAAIAPADDRFRHIRFLSATEFAASASARPRSAAIPVGGCHRDVPRVEPEPLEPEARRFVEWLLKQAGVDPDGYRAAPLARRIRACLRCLRARSVTEARQRLTREPQRVTEAVSALLIGVTQFFREPEVFSYVDKAVLPGLSAGGAGLRIWSAGCADGAELYSVAMLLAGRGLLERSALLGSDCRADAIRHARRGWFDATQLQSLEEPLRQAYFVPRQRGWQVCDVLRHSTRWLQGDALAGPPLGQPSWDLIFCRNVAIYLQPSAAARLWTVLAGSLRPGGVLVVGKAERPERQSSLAYLAPCVFGKGGLSR